nr:UvrD-helicase domain-containing protein [Roseicella aerolata]
MQTFLVANWQPSGKSGGNAVTGFKPTQELAMEAIRTRANDVMVALPTGEGKSVLFQVPALCRGLRNRRLTLVLSPLKALMRDQVARLHEQGFAESVDYLTSDRSSFENAEVLQGVLDHRIVLLYVAPERLRNATFVDVLDRRMQSDGGLEYVVFDETHCVNQWGYEFRPDYFYAFHCLLQRLRGIGRGQGDVTPFLLLSATITASDRRNLREILDVGSSGGAVLPLKICPDPETFPNPLRSHIQVEPLQVRGNIFDNQDFETALAERLPYLVDVVRKAQQNREATGQRSAVIVFVSRRAHAEDVASRLAKAVTCDVECFHAGLDSATRDDTYSRFRDGNLDVLVATKAFGMGMDIPDIHWVVHLSPPAYLEDYLQEVGRIGRGVNERKRAGLRRLSAVMLFSPADFENSRNLRATNQLRAPQIGDIEAEIVKRAQEIGGQKIAFVPQHGFEPYKSASQMRANATRLRMALHWLEKAEHLTQLGMVADLVTVDLFPTKLSELAKEQSIVGAVAQAVLSLASEPKEDHTGENLRPSPAESKGILGTLLQRLSDMIGVRVDRPREVASQHFVSTPDLGAVINLSQLRMQCRIRTMDDTMACLVDLQRRGGLVLRWTLEFAKRPLLSEHPERIDALFRTVGGAVRQLIRQLGTKGRAEFDPFQWLDESDWGLADPEQLGAASRKEKAELEARLKRYRRAYLHGFRSLARASGVRLEQAVREESEGVVWRGSLARSKGRTALDRCDEVLGMAPSLLSIFAEAEESGMHAEVYALIRRAQEAHPHKRFHSADLEALLRLFSAMNLVSTQPDLVPLSYVLALHNVPSGLEAHPELVEELNGVNDLAETRIFAMEVFANLPEQVRESFIGGYFAKANAGEIKGFLEAQLGEIEDDGENSSSFIAEKRDQLRATKASEFFSRFQQSEEPAQWEAIRYPFDRHLIVNAGPGAGKTSVLVGRIAHLIREQHVKPSEIMVLAFNRAVVFEIKQRVRELFRSLGYASYAGQVRVSTFHSLAMRSLHEAEGRDEQNRWDDLLTVFASKLSSNAQIRERVAGGCRSILVDEFQDVTEDVYSIIRTLYLGSGSRAGVMVIGDDDQDILRWQRRNTSQGGSEFSEVFFDRFKTDFGGEKLQTLDLKVNFRSGKEIVDLSQRMISTFFSKHTISRRLKNTRLRQCDGAAADRCERIDWRGKSWHESLDRVANICARLLTENPGSLAVLCRSNSEVAQVHHYLKHRIHRLAVQSGANMRIGCLRHVGHWIDFVEAEIIAQDRLLTQSVKEELLGSFREKFIIPETRSADDPGVDLSILWELCREEHALPHLSNLVRFIKDLQIDELQRLQGSRRGGTSSVVSTIHKVKGLEFDNVVIVPSRTGFGEDSAPVASLEKDAVEEARLLYVAMTRAKTRLAYLVGDREYDWAASPPRQFAGQNGRSRVLAGGLDEVGLGWAMQMSSFNPDPDDCQRYIEQEVCVGDPIFLGGLGSGANKGFMHVGKSGKSRQIGFLAKKYGAGDSTADLKVSAVVRYSPDEKDWAITGKLVRERGWGYAVLVAGRLR